ncbi:MAG: rhodanese-like domain-containing protein [Anaerolineae bacterium]|jgi:rhodanese-related sulfurtransferase|nr:rhodanese-like domain-containing protein [Chloroflexota bacterium]MBN8582707.1 rhodanese-like domain-containing protein [Anaerolineae bacterium]
MKQILLISLFLLVTLTACQSSVEEIMGKEITTASGYYKDITPAELDAMLSNKDLFLVNVHIPFAGNIADTDLSIPYDQISAPENLTQLPADKDAKIVLYCRSGRMSAIAAEELVSLGYTNIWNLEGGMVAWEQAGREIEK